ncbi:MAG: TlpA family protein disulfide reductase [Gemmatimonadetes bacterium]|nr:TlpA family protein disulfide reductase [Gemmatimonadota bacterium]
MSNSARKPGTTKNGKGRNGGNGRAGGKEAGRSGRWFRAVEVTLWVLVIGAVAYRFVPAAAAHPVAENGTAPDFTVKTLNGGKLSLSDLRGHVVLVNFWATWCPPCRLEIPGFQRVYQDYKDKGFTVVGLSTDEQGPGVVNAFIRQNGITYPVGMATDEMRRLYGGVDALPESFLLDESGRVRKRVEGMFNESILRQDVDHLLAEGEK